MLGELEIDFLGVSIDALLLTLPAEGMKEVKEVIRKAGVRIEEVGRVESGPPEAVLEVDGKEQDFSPRFRESAYTPVKKVADRKPEDAEAMRLAVEAAARKSLEKKERVIRKLKNA
jgi:hydrogenase expression/formation protein